ncbi:MAG: hypothetical protein R3251_00625 [Candidatus Spechtbacterales bacterium]|nr:hypothetical protein [Candidatus Spechtbacterales bacterium]
MVKVLRTAAEWCRELEITILDPDGWRYEGGEFDYFQKRITREEFEQKLALCTVSMDSKLFNRKDREDE